MGHMAFLKMSKGPTKGAQGYIVNVLTMRALIIVRGILTSGHVFLLKTVSTLAPVQ
jgi:ribosomal protein L24